MYSSEKYKRQRDQLLKRFEEDPNCKKHMDILLDSFYENINDSDGECSGIGLDGKRPFGNSSIAYDIAEIIGIEIDEEGWSKNTKEYCYWLYDHLWAYIKYIYSQSKH
jgi:hypothetical protein